MINSGAILVSSMIQHEKDLADRYDYVIISYKSFYICFTQGIVVKRVSF
jgi:glutaminase